jgi:outer membrane protein TolC
MLTSILMLLSFAAASPEPLALEAAMDLAERRPVVAAERARADASHADVAAALLGAVGPRVGGELTTTERTEEIAITTPIGAFVQQPKRVVDAGVRGEVPLDLGALLGAVPAARSAARDADARADRAVDRARLDAAEAFLDVLAVDVRIAALETSIAALTRALVDTDARVAVGAAVPADRLRIEGALADAEAGLHELRAGRSAALDALAWRIGGARPEQLDPDLPPAIAPATSSPTGRDDLRALDDQRRALGHQRHGAALAALPTVAAWGRWVATDNAVLVDNTWVEGGLAVRWTPIAGGARIAQDRRFAAEQRSIDAAIADARAGMIAEAAGARAAFEASTAALPARDRARASAAEAERLVHERLRQGLATVTDALSATAARADAEARAGLARIDAARAAARWRFAVGERP